MFWVVLLPSKNRSHYRVLKSCLYYLSSQLHYLEQIALTHDCRCRGLWRKCRKHSSHLSRSFCAFMILPMFPLTFPFDRGCLDLGQLLQIVQSLRNSPLQFFLFLLDGRAVPGLLVNMKVAHGLQGLVNLLPKLQPPIADHQDKIMSNFRVALQNIPPVTNHHRA